MRSNVDQRYPIQSASNNISHGGPKLSLYYHSIFTHHKMQTVMPRTARLVIASPCIHGIESQILRTAQSVAAKTSLGGDSSIKGQSLAFMKLASRSLTKIS